MFTHDSPMMENKAKLSKMMSAVNSCRLGELQSLLNTYGLFCGPELLNGYTLLCAAIRTKRKDVVALLLSHGARVNNKRVRQLHSTPLHLAVIFFPEDKKLLRILFERNAAINALNENHETPLHVAISHSHVTSVKVLLENGAEINTKSSNGTTPLHTAVQRGTISVIRVLLKYDVKINVRSRTFLETALYWAVENDNSKIVNLLLHHGADANSKTWKKNTPLHSAIDSGRLEIIKILLNNGANVNIKSISERAPLHCAVEKGHPEIVKLLLLHGADINAKNSEGLSPLHLASELILPSATTIARILINAGADVNDSCTSEVNTGYTPLHFAVIKKDEELVKLLSEKGANHYARAEDGLDPLDIAVYEGFIEGVRLLLQTCEKNIDGPGKHGKSKIEVALDRVDYYYVNGISEWAIAYMLLKNGATIIEDQRLLMLAMENNSSDIVRMFFEQFPDYSETNDFDIDGQTILHRAVQNHCLGGVIGDRESRRKIVETFLRYGADSNRTSKLGFYPMYDCINSGKHPERPTDVGTLGLLLDHFADIESGRQDNGMTPLHLAARKGDVPVVKFLLNSGADINAKDCEGWTVFDHTLKSCRRTLKRYVEQFLALGRGIDQSCSRAGIYINGDSSYFFKLDECYDRCKDEVLRMKETKIGESNVSFYDVVAEDVSQMAVCARNSEIETVLSSNDYVEIFPIYFEMIKGHFRRAQRREKLLRLSLEAFMLVNGYTLPDDCVADIIGYLEVKDLLNLINAAK